MLVNKLLLHVEENYDNIEQHTNLFMKKRGVTLL